MQHALPFLIESPASPPSQVRPSRHIVLGGTAIPYSFRRSSRKTIGISIDEHGLHAAAPRWAKLEEVEAFLLEKQKWILRRLFEAQLQRRPPFRWEAGARIPYLGRELRVEFAETEQIELNDDRLQVNAMIDAAGLRRSVIDWFKRKSLDCFSEKIAQTAPRLEVPVPLLRLSQARTQWGSCTRDKEGNARVLLNWKLMHYEEHLIDYVVAHELAHLRHMNHSARFWHAVAQVYPNYVAARRELRERAHWAPEL